MSATRRAIVLLSGGVDSATALALAMCEGFEVNALSFHYGQRHAIELEFARRLAVHFSVAEHHRVDIDPRAGLNGLSGSVLWRQHRQHGLVVGAAQAREGRSGGAGAGPLRGRCREAARG